MVSTYLEKKVERADITSIYVGNELQTSLRKIREVLYEKILQFKDFDLYIELTYDIVFDLIFNHQISIGIIEQMSKHFLKTVNNSYH